MGSAVGHTLGHAMTGAFSGNKDEASQSQQYEQPQQQQGYAQPAQQANQNDPCAYEMQQFLQCAQNYPSDLTLCQAFNEQLKQCKANYGQQ